MKPILSTVFDLLTFRISREQMGDFGPRHLVFGFLCTWVAGMGRYWDDPGAGLLQHLGVGSLIYVCVLSFMLWIIIRPLGPVGWSYRHVLTFVTLTAIPGLFYAIPVERMFDPKIAQDLNVVFLGVVAVWRVSLLFFYLSRWAQLGGASIFLAVTLPLTLIITSLTFLNLERAVFDVMGGMRGTANDGAYLIMILLTFTSTFLFIPLLVGYVALVIRNRAPHP